MTDLIPIGPEWRNLFETFEHTAFRLEVREAYNVPSEHEPMRRFLAGDANPDWLSDWLVDIRKDTDDGKVYRRVRVVSLPLSDYSRFGLAFSNYNNDAGEDIRYLLRDNANELPTFDYWLFDSRTAAKMHFGDQDNLLGFELIEEPAVVVELNYWRDAAWHRAMTRDEFASQHLK
ncbi:hypothetical protein C8K30_101469 [Promicromonospora sp. AC04]|uniref:DUF6879 family protein n=1 Tax=Promicromonospora sp. AC04 TaxID=2135723 RepID=UPI000D336DA0|nr:DUF6879 family protein [Promicromonospora sp. AC04]PUB31949.1 hypothetical protein C8K30_101469 [Promicromonospora sp. AC04]